MHRALRYRRYNALGISNDERSRGTYLLRTTSHLVGTTGNDQFPEAVFGTTADDVVHALAGDDNVYAIALDADPQR